MGPARSGGPLDLDPGGTCPNNPEDGKLLGGKEDYEEVVLQRIHNAEARAHQAEQDLRRVAPGERGLAEELAAKRILLMRYDQVVTEIRKILGKVP